MAVYKNVASQKLAVFAVDSTGAPKTGDAANITAYVSKDGGAATASNDTNPTELDATNAKGIYLFDMTQSETNADLVVLVPKSSTSGVTLRPVIVYTVADIYGRLGAPAGASIAADVATVAAYIDTEVGAIKTVTDAIGATGSGLSAIPWNAAWDAEVQSECADALVAYDPPTQAEMDARTLPSASYATPTNITAGTITTVTTLTNDPTGVTTLLSRLSSARAGYLDNLSAGAVALEASLQGLITTVAGLAAACATAVWAAATRTLTAFGFTVTTSDSANVTAIKAKTDNLPADPADASDIAAAFATVNSAIATLQTYVDTEVAAILAKVTNLPDDPADQSVLAGAIATLQTYVDTEVAAIKTVTDHLATAMEVDGGVYRFTVNALEQAPAGGGGGGASAEAIADAVWDELRAGHRIDGSFGAGVIVQSNLDKSGYILLETLSAPSSSDDSLSSMLDAVAIERSTYTIRASFRDEFGAVIVPDSLAWSLTNSAGTVINGRQRVVVVNPESTQEITLTGADLAILDDTMLHELRYLTIEATYDNGKTLKEEASFWVRNLRQV